MASQPAISRGQAPIRRKIFPAQLGLRSWFQSILRDEYFAGLCILGCANGLGFAVINSVHTSGWRDALINTFGVSGIVWVACFFGVTFVLQNCTGKIQPRDLGMGAAFLVLIIVPIGWTSWAALTVLCLYMLMFTDANPSRIRGATLLLAVTLPMVWSHLALHFFARPVLDIDASMVSWLLGTDRIGNMIRFADDSGYLVIFPSCSSLAGVSLAILCWVTACQVTRHKRCAFDVLWCGLACASVVVINIARMGFMGLSDWHYQTVHDQWGASLANVLTLAFVAGFSLLGVRHELLSRI